MCGERNPPTALTDHAEAIGARLLEIGRDFDFVVEGAQWRYRGPGGERYGLPVPALRGDYQFANASTALAALDQLRDRIPITAGAIREGLVAVELPGRFQVLPGRPTIVLGQSVRPGNRTEHVDHYSILRTIEDWYGLAPLGVAAQRQPLTLA